MEESENPQPGGRRESQVTDLGSPQNSSPGQNLTSQAVDQPAQASSTSAPPARTRMLLACDRCRSRKSKCDRNLPSCTSCLQAGVPCMTAERDRFLSTDGRHVPRGYIEDLERKVQVLEGQYHNILLQSGMMSTPGTGSTPFMGPPPVIPVGIESGPGILMSVEQSTNLQPTPLQQPQTLQLGFNLASPTTDPLSFENTLLQAVRLSGSDPLKPLAPNLLFSNMAVVLNDVSALHFLQNMDRETVSKAINMYFDFVHAHYPLLVREDVVRKYSLMMQASYQPGMMRPSEEVVVYLVVIIGMTVSADLHSAPIYPHMLYYAALRTPNLFSDEDSISMIQSLILIVIYSLYDPNAGPSWHLLDIVVGKCLSLSLHLISSTLGNGIESAAKAWAFWTIYSLDRMSGASMGRPFTIANDDIITVPMPGLRQPGESDGTGFLSGPLITYFQILYRARRDPDVGFDYWQEEFSRWRDSTKTSVAIDIQLSAANTAAPEYVDAMNTYIDLVYYQGLLLIPQFNIEYPSVTSEITGLYGSETMYVAAKMVGLSFSVHRFPLAWTAGYKAFATGMSYLLSLTQRDRTEIKVPELYHVSTACITTIENVAAKFEGLTPYGKFLIRSTDMMLRLFSVENGSGTLSNDPYFLYTPYSDAMARSPNSGIPRAPMVEALHVRKFRSLARLYLAAMEDIRLGFFPDT